MPWSSRIVLEFSTPDGQQIVREGPSHLHGDPPFAVGPRGPGCLAVVRVNAFTAIPQW